MPLPKFRFLDKDCRGESKVGKISNSSMYCERGGSSLSYLVACKNKNTGQVVTSIMCLALAFGMNSSWAREWYYESSIAITAEYDDNIQLVSDQEADDIGLIEGLVEEPIEEATGIFIVPTITIGTGTPRSSVEFNLGADVNRYSEDELDNDGFSVGFLSSRLTEKSVLGLELSFDRDTSLTTEDFEDAVFVREVLRRESATATPSISYQINEANTFDAELEYSDVTYDDRELAGPFDFRTISFAPTFTHIVNERTNWFIAGDLSTFESPENDDTETDDLSLSVGIGRQLSPSSNGQFSVGRQESDSEVTRDGVRITSSDDGAIYSAGLSWVLPLTTASVELSRSLDSTGFGSRSERTGLTFGVSRALSETKRIFLDISASDDSFISVDDDEIPDRKSISLEPGFTWELTTNWEFETSYTYRKLEFDAVEVEPLDDDIGLTTIPGEEATSNSVRATVRYRLPRKPF